MCFFKVKTAQKEDAFSFSLVLLTHLMPEAQENKLDTRKVPSFLSLCSVALAQTLTVIRTWWLLIVSNNWLKVTETAGFSSPCWVWIWWIKLLRPRSALCMDLNRYKVFLPMNLPYFAFCILSIQQLCSDSICSLKVFVEKIKFQGVLGIVSWNLTLKFFIFKEEKITQFKRAIIVLLFSARTAFGNIKLTSVCCEEKWEISEY